MELSEARRLVNARDEFVNNAKQEAESIRRSAEDAARTMVDQQSVYTAARQKAEDMVQDAEKKSRELRRVASNYLDDALRQTESTIVSPTFISAITLVTSAVVFTGLPLTAVITSPGWIPLASQSEPLETALT